MGLRSGYFGGMENILAPILVFFEFSDGSPSTKIFLTLGLIVVLALSEYLMTNNCIILSVHGLCQVFVKNNSFAVTNNNTEFNFTDFLFFHLEFGSSFFNFCSLAEGVFEFLNRYFFVFKPHSTDMHIYFSFCESIPFLRVRLYPSPSLLKCLL